MNRRKVLLVGIPLLLLLAGLLGSFLGSIKPAAAIQGGNPNTDMTKSVARLTFTGRYAGHTYNNDEACTGSVVGDGWILTALHCFYPLGTAASPMPLAGWQVQLWKAGVTNINKPDYFAKPDQIVSMAGGSVSGINYRDVALLHVPNMPTWVKTIPSAFQWPAIGTALTEYGYGRTSADGPVSTSLEKTQQGSLTRADCPSGASWSNGNLCIKSSSSLPWRGDSGGPLLWWNNGYWQQVGSFSLFPDPKKLPNQKWRSYWSEADGDTRSWVLSTIGATAPIGAILRDEASGASWLYEADGSRHWIPDGGTYNCLVQNGATVLNRPLRTVEALPDMVGSWANCTLPPPPPKTWAETAGGVAHTWTNYQNAGGSQGPSVAQYQTIQIACKITGFKVSDGNTWWYRIAQAPWNNQYYVSADAFYNNGATSGPLKGTPFVDSAVPNC